MYSIEVQSHRGVKVVGESNDKTLATKIMWDQTGPAVVVNGSGRVVATNVRRTF